MDDREKFEADAETYGFNLERFSTSLPTIEPWSDYKDDNTGHRWGGFLAGAESKQSELDLLQIEVALYSSDAKRCWGYMPELENTGAAYELHEAVQIKTDELDKANTTIEFLEAILAGDGAQITGLKSELDKANARIEQLEEALKVYLQAGVCQSTDFHLQLKANRLALAISESSDTWLIEHDKAVEVRILKEVREKTKDTFGFKV